MGETAFGVALVVAIMGVSATATHHFAPTMQVTCPKCRTLDARRRSRRGHRPEG